LNCHRSIVILLKGLHGFIDTVVDGDEYRQAFGSDIVPYQRVRRMEGRAQPIESSHLAIFGAIVFLGRIDSRSYYPSADFTSRVI
jgi:phycobilisome rod-core linker protein